MNWRDRGHWDEEPPPEQLRHRIEPLEEWATTAVNAQRLSNRVTVRPSHQTELLRCCSRERIDVGLEEEYLADEAVPIDHLQFLVGHEIGEAKLKLQGSALDGKPKEHAADCVGAELVGKATAAAAICAYQRWQEQRGTPFVEDSKTYPTTEERIRHVIEDCPST